MVNVDPLFPESPNTGTVCQDEKEQRSYVGTHTDDLVFPRWNVGASHFDLSDENREIGCERVV